MSASRQACQYLVVGIDDDENYMLSKTLRQMHGKENVHRHLELDHAESFIAARTGTPLIVCLDLFGFEPTKALAFIGQVRQTYPRVVFSLYVGQQEWTEKRLDLPPEWANRLLHYYRLHKESGDEALALAARASLRQPLWEAERNTTHEPIRITPVFQKGLVTPGDSTAKPDKSPISFISYARADWAGFVSDFSTRLSASGSRVWLDQNYIEGGSDWLDAIGEALDVCDVLLLVLSPQALASKYVKMEYRYFFLNQKPIVPVVFQNAPAPFELSAIQQVDFTAADRAKSYETLTRVLSNKAGKPK